MRIYLDNCVYQDFNRGKADELFALIQESKRQNVYYFSEAHLYDLVRDTTDHKFRDMELMEKVAGNNSYHYVDKIEFDHWTPRQYYGRFNWTPTTTYWSIFSEYPMFGAFKLQPLNFAKYIQPEQMPADAPQQFIEILQGSTTFYEFFRGFLEYTETITDEQRQFKELIRYLHNHGLAADIYKYFGIEGFDGVRLTDKEAFKDSFINYYAKTLVDTRMNSLFPNMYVGLELFGIVKGKPKKQHMMNMLNDGKHAYFGAFSDVIVSNDEDFLNKTKFLYDMLGTRTAVVSSFEFTEMLKDLVNVDTKIESCLDAIRSFDYDAAEKCTGEKGDYFILSLGTRVFGFFNRIVYASRGEFDNYYFERKTMSWSTATLAREIELIVNILIDELGPDYDQFGNFQWNEFDGPGWRGRIWYADKFLSS